MRPLLLLIRRVKQILAGLGFVYCRFLAEQKLIIVVVGGTGRIYVQVYVRVCVRVRVVQQRERGYGLRNEKKSQMASRKWRFSWSNKYAVPINIFLVLDGGYRLRRG
jgi:hypothetical protein